MQVLVHINIPDFAQSNNHEKETSVAGKFNKIVAVSMSIKYKKLGK
jgi:hypothetical protein